MKCLGPFFHRFTKWELLEKGEIVKKTLAFGIEINPDNRRPIGNYIMQRRICKDCGRIEMRNEEVYI